VIKRFLVLGIILCTVLSGCHGTNARPDVNTLVKPNQQLVLREALPDPVPLVMQDLVVFGDSLSDTGRLHRRSAGLYIPPDIYWQGRITNGPNWTDYVCGALNCRVLNHAVAGAATRLDDFFLRWVLRPLDAQVEEFLSEEAETISDKTVAVIWIGANNYLKTPDMKPDEARADIKAAAARLLKGPIQRLLIGSMPSLAGLLKAPNREDPVSFEQYREITFTHNRNMLAVISELQQEFPGKSIALYDAYEINQATVDRPSDFGFTSLKDGCYKGNYRGEYHGEPGFCSDYLGWKFWDYTHPNSRMHCYYAARFLQSLHEAGWLEEVDADKAIDRCRHF
jgi:phospholipase/lecithinase/hemolysin